LIVTKGLTGCRIVRDRSYMHKTSEWLLSFTSEDEVNKSSDDQFIEEARGCRKISVTGGKGGVGKTSIALKTAQELARVGYRTLLIDCDSNLSNTAIKLGLPVDNKFEKLLSAEISFEEALIQRGNFHLLSACNGSLSLFENKLQLDEVIIDIIESHEHEYDYILLDCPAGLEKQSLKLNSYCDHRFVVVTPDRSSITDSYSLIKILALNFGVKRNHLIVNMYQQEKQYLRVAEILTDTIERFLGCQTVTLGGIRKIDVDFTNFDTFFLAEDNNEFQKNFVKLLYGFTEKLGEPVKPLLTKGNQQLALEHDVH